MKINNNKIGEIQRKYFQQKRGLEKVNKTRSKDSMSISAKARQINNIDKILADIPDVRADKVESLKKAISNGTYEIDSKKIAAKILGSIDQE